MNNRLLPVWLLFALAFTLIPSITFASSLSVSPNPFTLSNTIINPGQYSTANTQVSGGSNGPYSAQWTWINSNEVNNQVINTITVGSDPYSVSFNPSGTLDYVANYNSGTVNVIQVSSNSVINTITVGTDPYSVAFSHSGSLAYVVNFGSGTVNVIQVSSNSVINTITVGSDPTSVAFNPSGTLAYVANFGSGTVNVIQVSSNSVINTITVGTDPISTAFNPSGTLAYVTNDGSGTVNVIQVSSNSVINTITVGSNPSSVALSPSGSLAYVVNEESSGTISVIGNLPETSLQEVPSSGLMQLTAHAVNSNTIDFTFNGVTYTQNTGQNTAYGAWKLYGFVQDNGTDTYYYGSNTILLSNTLTIDPALSVSISASPALPASLNVEQTETFNAITSGGSGTYTTYNFLIYNSITNIEVGNLLTTNNGFTYTIPSGEASNTLYANVTVTDSNANTGNSVHSGIMTITNPSTPQPSSGICSGNNCDTAANLPTTTKVTTSPTTTINPTTTIPTTVPQHNIAINVPKGNSTVKICNATSAPYIVNYGSIGASFKLVPNGLECGELTAVNVTRQNSNATVQNYTETFAVNVSASQVLLPINATLHYNCSLQPSSIAPYLLKNGTWDPIIPFNVNASACSVSFAITSDPVIGIFKANVSETTTVQPTTTSQPQVPSPSPNSNELYAAIAAIVIIIVAAYLVFSRKKKGFGR